MAVQKWTNASDMECVMKMILVEHLVFIKLTFGQFLFSDLYSAKLNYFDVHNFHFFFLFEMYLFINQLNHI